jgi:diketogulonate reductase-like aldo/keto reductase|eukprot:gene9367-6709_t
MSSDSKETVVLSNGVALPALGFGCAFGNWTDSSRFIGFTPEEGWSSIPAAFRSGYKLFDSALMYNTHQVLGYSIGKELAEGKVKRSDIFVTTKLFHPRVSVAFNELDTTADMDLYLRDASLDIRPKLRRDFERSLNELNLGYVDLLLVHWPGLQGWTDKESGDRLRAQVWEVFEEIYASGRARAIGVSNFLVRHLEPLLATCKVAPHVNQIELHPYRTQAALVDFCKARGIAVQGWSPFGNGAIGLFQDPVLQRLAAKYGKDVGQIILRWLVQQGIATLPKSSSESRMRSNLDVFDFVLEDGDVAEISALDKDHSCVVTSENIA